MIDRYFDLLEETLLENELKDCPCQIFNMDESRMPLDQKSMKTIHVRGDPNPVTTTTGNKAQITVVACVSASGNYIPPMIVWDRKSLKQEWTTGEVAGTLHGMLSKGWMDMSLFEKWFTRHFLRYAPPDTTTSPPHGWSLLSLLSFCSETGSRGKCHLVCTLS